jgi:hypothetical protein
MMVEHGDVAELAAWVEGDPELVQMRAPGRNTTVLMEVRPPEELRTCPNRGYECSPHAMGRSGGVRGERGGGPLPPRPRSTRGGPRRDQVHGPCCPRPRAHVRPA